MISLVEFDVDMQSQKDNPFSVFSGSETLTPAAKAREIINYLFFFLLPEILMIKNYLTFQVHYRFIFSKTIPDCQTAML